MWRPARNRTMAGVFTFVALCSLPAAGQTRADEQRQERAAKAAVVQPPQRNPAERVVDGLKRYGVLGEPVAGLYPIVTTVYPGGWLAFGGGYRRPFRDTGAVNLQAAWSMKNYKVVDGVVRLPSLARGRVALEVNANWLDAPTVAFYGVGNESRTDDRRTYGYRPTSAGLTATVTPQNGVRLGGAADYVAIETTAPTEAAGDEVPTFAWPRSAGIDPTYLRTRVFAEWDYRARPGYSGSGGAYRLEATDYADRSGSRSGFRTIEAEAVQLVPILRANWVIALRGLATITNTDGDNEVPFFLMPSLGGNGSLRGYSSFRFRDRHRLLLSAEYRWTPARFMDMALFYDVGKVAARTSDLDLTALKTSYGIGARFHGDKRTGFRLELARNDEGSLRLVWSTKASF